MAFGVTQGVLLEFSEAAMRTKTISIHQIVCSNGVFPPDSFVLTACLSEPFSNGCDVCFVRIGNDGTEKAVGSGLLLTQVIDHNRQIIPFDMPFRIENGNKGGLVFEFGTDLRIACPSIPYGKNLLTISINPRQREACPSLVQAVVRGFLVSP